MCASEPSSKFGLEPFTCHGRTIGYVWHCPESSLMMHSIMDGRVLIVIDDFYDLPVWNYRPIASHAYGLRELLDYAIQSPDVKAIGFFDLPDSDHLEASQLIIHGIHSWISTLNLSNVQYYMLVDYFFSSNIMLDKAFGIHFVENWIQNCSIPVEIAYLSIGGLPNINPYGHKFPVFRKTMVHESRGLPLTLLNWLKDVQQIETLNHVFQIDDPKPVSDMMEH